MSNLAPENLLELLDVQLDAFAMCEIDRGCGLAVKASNTILVHFVLEGEGAISCEHGRYDLRAGRVILIPRNMAKTIEGPSPIRTVIDAEQGCPLAPGLVRFRASPSGTPGLVLGCGSISVGMGGTPGLLDHLDRPLVEECDGGPLPMLFAGMAAELRQPGPGTKAMVEALMKQILVVVLRSHLSRRLGESPLNLMLKNPQLGRAVAAVVTRPEDHHSVESLAAIAGMSRSSFNRQFAGSYGCTPMEFVQGVRLRAAARMLVSSGLPVKAIAAAVGYASRSHFSRAFTAQFGTDPTKFRATRDEASLTDVSPATPAADLAAAREDAGAAELRNQIRNTLARARSVARRTSRGSTSVDQFASDLEARLTAMGRAEAISPDQQGSDLRLGKLVGQVLGSQAAAAGTSEGAGPEVMLDRKSGEVMTLALHELAAYSRRHGALSAGAAPHVAWTVEERAGQPWLHLRWEEPRAGDVQVPEYDFGTELITRRIAYELGGHGSVDYGAECFTAAIGLPLARAAASGANPRLDQDACAPAMA
jgi:AraC-like DNA-binding protein